MKDKPVQTSFTEAELKLLQKNVTKLYSRVEREKTQYPGAGLWKERPTVIEDLAELNTAVEERLLEAQSVIASVPMLPYLCKMLARELVDTYDIRDKDARNINFETTDDYIKKLAVKLGNIS